MPSRQLLCIRYCAECRDKQNKFPAVKNLTQSLVGAMNRKTILTQPEKCCIRELRRGFVAPTTLSRDGIRVWHPPGARERQCRQGRSEKLCPQTQRAGASRRGRTICGHCSQEAQAEKWGVDESRWRLWWEGPGPCTLLRLWRWATEFCNQGSNIIRCVLERWVWEHHCQGWTSVYLSSFSSSVMSDSFWPHGLQHARLPCLSPSPGAYSNLCPSSWWCHPTISSSIIPFSSCL